MAGNFIGLKEFYNFIKSEDGRNSPTSFYYFSVYFYPENTSFFDNEKLERLRKSIQKIDLPKSSLKGYENNQLIEATQNIDNIFGAYTFLKNAYFNTDSRTITMRLLNLQYPVIEDIIYPWFYNCVRNEWSYSNNEMSPSFPKLSMIIKFWSGNNVEQAATNSASNVFEYFVTGLFPINIENYSPAHQTSGDDNRAVDFAFNEFRAYMNNGDRTIWNKHYFSTNIPPNLSNLKKDAELGEDTGSGLGAETTGNSNGETLKREAEAKAAAAAAAAATAQAAQRRDAHNWLQNSIANAASAAVGSFIKNNYSSNLISDLKKKASSKNGSSNNQSSKKTPVKDLVKQQLTNKNLKEDEKSDINFSSEILDRIKDNETNKQVNDLVQDKFEETIKQGDLGSLKINEVMNMLKDYKNASSTDSNMSLNENQILVETMNVDNEFGIILDSEDEQNAAVNSRSEMIKSSSNVSDNIRPELTSKENITSNNQTPSLTKNDLHTSTSITSNKKDEKTLDELDTTIDTKEENEEDIKPELFIKDDVKLNDNKFDKDLSLSKKDLNTILKNSMVNMNKKEQKTLDEIDVSIEEDDNTENETTLTKDDLINFNNETIDKVSSKLSLSEVSGSINKIQEFIVTQGRMSLNDVSSLYTNKNLEKSTNDIKNNLTLAESKEIFETLSIDDEFGEILESEDELEAAKQNNIEKYKEINSLETEQKIDQISETIDINEKKLVNYVEKSELNFDNIQEKYNQNFNNINSLKNETIEIKKEELDNYTSNQLNTEFGLIHSNKTLNETILKNEEFIKNKEKTSELRIDNLSSNFMNELKTKEESRNTVISGKFNEMDNFVTYTSNKYDEIEKIEKNENIVVKNFNSTNKNDGDEKRIISNKQKNEKIENERKNNNQYIKKKDEHNEFLINRTQNDLNNVNSSTRKKYEDIKSLLSNNKKLSVEKYSYLNIYADNENLDIKDVVKDYKTKANEDLENFIHDIILSNLQITTNTITNSPLNALNNLSLDQQGYTIKSDVTSYNIMNNHTIVINDNTIKEKMTSDEDINDLFS